MALTREEADELRAGVNHLLDMIDQGFGDVAFKKALIQFRAKVNKMVGPDAETAQKAAPKAQLMVLDPETGEQRPATAEDLAALGRVGAPVRPGSAEVGKGNEDPDSFSSAEDRI